MNEGFFSTFSWIVEAAPVVSLGTVLNNKHRFVEVCGFVFPQLLGKLTFLIGTTYFELLAQIYTIYIDSYKFMVGQHPIPELLPNFF